MAEAKTHYEVIVVGAGVAGIYQIKRLVDLGIDATVLDSAADLGGTWYWNRYPGCRFDSESYTYGFSFSRELLDEWHWKERFSGQPENLRYLQYVADKFDMSRGFIVPMFCFVLVALYGFAWPKLSNAESLRSVSAVKGH